MGHLNGVNNTRDCRTSETIYNHRTTKETATQPHQLFRKNVSHYPLSSLIINMRKNLINYLTDANRTSCVNKYTYCRRSNEKPLILTTPNLVKPPFQILLCNFNRLLIAVDWNYYNNVFHYVYYVILNKYFSEDSSNNLLFDNQGCPEPFSLGLSEMFPQ